MVNPWLTKSSTLLVKRVLVNGLPLLPSMLVFRVSQNPSLISFRSLFTPSTVTLIGEAVFARCLSSLKQERVRASKVIAGPQKEAFHGDKKQFIDDLEQALYASKIISYTQGFMLMRQTAKDVGFRALCPPSFG